MSISGAYLHVRHANVSFTKNGIYYWFVSRENHQVARRMFTFFRPKLRQTQDRIIHTSGSAWQNHLVSTEMNAQYMRYVDHSIAWDSFTWNLISRGRGHPLDRANRSAATIRITMLQINSTEYMQHNFRILIRAIGSKDCQLTHFAHTQHREHRSKRKIPLNNCSPRFTWNAWHCDFSSFTWICPGNIGHDIWNAQLTKATQCGICTVN